MKVAVGHSDDPDSADAIEEILEHCRATLDGAKPTAAIVYSSLDQDYDVVLDAIHAAFGDIALIGCTTDGELSSEQGFMEDSLVVIFFSSERVRIAVGAGRMVNEDHRAAAAEAMKQARESLGADIAMCIALPTRAGDIGSAVTQALVHEAGEGIPVFGGIAADQWTFDTTYQFFGREVCTNIVPVMLFSAPLALGCGRAAGWMPIGNRHPAVGNGARIDTIGDRTGLGYYHKYLGTDSTPPSEAPLAIFEPGRDDYYLLNPVVYDPDAGWIELSQPIPEGCEVQLTQATRDTILEATRQSVNAAMEEYPGDKPDFGLFFSCAARRQILGTRSHTEEETIRELTPDALPYAGFYAYGEIGPGRHGASAFNTVTLISVLVGECD